jgi:hypothetical protein
VQLGNTRHLDVRGGKAGVDDALARQPEVHLEPVAR